MLLALEESARRLEQQIVSFEKLHNDELKRFQEQLETYQRLQNDEMQMLRDQLKRLKEEILALPVHPTDPPVQTTQVPPEPGMTRRQFLTTTLRTIEHT